MDRLRDYYEYLKPYWHRKQLELATIGVMLLCGLFVWVGSISTEGRLSLKEGALIYEGQVVRQKMSGEGQLTFSNGDRYEGQFSNGVFQGQGIFRAKSGWTYEGSFDHNLPHGKGKLTTETGIVYEGNFEKGVYQDAD